MSNYCYLIIKKQGDLINVEFSGFIYLVDLDTLETTLKGRWLTKGNKYMPIIDDKLYIDTRGLITSFSLIVDYNKTLSFNILTPEEFAIEYFCEMLQ